MSKIKNGGLDQYGAEPFEQQQFGPAGVEGVNLLVYNRRTERGFCIERRPWPGVVGRRHALINRRGQRPSTSRSLRYGGHATCHAVLVDIANLRNKPNAPISCGNRRGNIYGKRWCRARRILSGIAIFMLRAADRSGKQTTLNASPFFSFPLLLGLVIYHSGSLADEYATLSLEHWHYS